MAPKTKKKTEATKVRDPFAQWAEARRAWREVTVVCSSWNRLPDDQREAPGVGAPLRHKVHLAEQQLATAADGLLRIGVQDHDADAIRRMHRSLPLHARRMMDGSLDDPLEWDALVSVDVIVDRLEKHRQKPPAAERDTDAVDQRQRERREWILSVAEKHLHRARTVSELRRWLVAERTHAISDKTLRADLRAMIGSDPSLAAKLPPVGDDPE